MSFNQDSYQIFNFFLYAWIPDASSNDIILINGIVTFLDLNLNF